MTTIRMVRRAELEALRGLEREAGRLFAAIGMAEVAAAQAPTLADLEVYRTAGRAWVTVDAWDRPLGYLLSSIVDGCAHIDQVSVAPAYARRGLGASLIEHLAATAAVDGRPALTLTAFRDVPWNAPYYTRLGFVVIEPANHGTQLRALIAHEATSIPSDAQRVAMRRPLIEENPRGVADYAH